MLKGNWKEHQHSYSLTIHNCLRGLVWWDAGGFRGEFAGVRLKAQFDSVELAKEAVENLARNLANRILDELK